MTLSIELTAAVRAGAVNLVEQIVFDLTHEAYSNGRKGIEQELRLARENRNEWRTLAFDSKDKLIAQQELLKKYITLVTDLTEVIERSERDARKPE